MYQNPLPDYDLTKLESIQKEPLIVAVAGHANQGKTSVVRTLCRMPEFGEVRDFPGTTKTVSGVRFKIDGKTYMIIFDTPGFQNSAEAIKRCGDHFKIEDIISFFEQQALSDDYQALKQVFVSDVVLYVIDGTCEPTEALRSDFRLLACSGVPVIPLFNFSKDSSSESEQAWVDFLHHNNYHLEVKYDAHYYRADREHDLYEKMRVLLRNDLHRTFFDWHVDWRAGVESNMGRNAIDAMAAMLLDCSCYSHQIVKVESKMRNDAERQASDRFVKTIGRRECSGFQEMVAAYGFRPDLLERNTGAADHKALWDYDLFGKAIERHLGIGVAGGAIAGAGSGFIIDSAMAWHSLFLGTIVGAVSAQPSAHSAVACITRSGTVACKHLTSNAPRTCDVPWSIAHCCC